MFGTALASAGIGFVDDWLKIVKARSLGLSARTKLGCQLLIAIGLWAIATQVVGLNETLKLRGLGNLRILAVRSDLLSRGVPLLFRHGLSQADALQIESCRDIRADAFVCADEKLLRAAKGEGLVSLDPVRDSSRIRAL